MSERNKQAPPKTPEQIIMEAMIVGAQCLADLDGQVHVNAIHCPYCGTTSPDMEAATAHDGQCEKHPMAVRCAELRAANARLREALEQARSANVVLAYDDSRPWHKKYESVVHDIDAALAGQPEAPGGVE